MRIDEALAESTPLEVKFSNGNVLYVEYRPPSFTLEEMEAAAEDKENPHRLVKQIRDLIVTWDLTERLIVDGEPVIGEDGRPVEVPISLAPLPKDADPKQDPLFTKVPFNIYAQIIKAIKEHQSPSGEA